MSKRQRYHHGDLAEEIMQRAIEHIEADGTEKLSLRALAREAGVSQTAPYRHFPTKRCLLAALATQGFCELHQDIERVVAQDASAADRFVDMGLAYVNFARENPTKYHLMFGAVLDDFSEYEMLERAARACFAEVRTMLSELIQDHPDAAKLDQLSGITWAGVHGVASLLLNNRHRNRAAEDTQKALAAMAADIEGSLRILYARILSA